MIIVNLVKNSATLAEALLSVLAFVVALVLSLTLHEVAHGVVALWNGDPTAKFSGRLSLNPAKHFDPVGLLVMLVCGFGWAKPVPVNPYNFKKRRVGMFTVSVAGIVTNFLLAFLFALPCAAIFGARVEVNSFTYYLLSFLLNLSSMMVLFNVSLALFNLLPLYPLDGSRILGCIIGEDNKFMNFLRRYSFYILLGLVVLGNIPVVKNYSPFNWYLVDFRNVIYNAFISFWGLIV